MKNVGFAAGTAVLTAGTPTVMALTLDAGVDVNSKRIPVKPLLDRLELNLSGLGASNMMVTAYFTYDAAGLIVASNEPDMVDIVKVGAGTVGGGVIPLTGFFDFLRDGAVVGTLYAWVTVDGSGTPGADGRLIFDDTVP